MHGSYVIPAKAGVQKKRYKYNKFLKLKARFISLYAGFPLLARNDIEQIS
ncbi:hypothetical protein [Rickettsia asembonensis]|nr:hypothetical protein [Rickettsia asembonensis]